MSGRGLFIVLEGIDHSGKTTQTKLLVENISKFAPVQHMWFPRRDTDIGRQIDSYLKNSLNIDDTVIHDL